MKRYCEFVQFVYLHPDSLWANYLSQMNPAKKRPATASRFSILIAAKNLKTEHSPNRINIQLQFSAGVVVAQFVIALTFDADADLFVDVVLRADAVAVGGGVSTCIQAAGGGDEDRAG
jgi:hypothetical protein